jgi:hypothetical protein
MVASFRSVRRLFFLSCPPLKVQPAIASLLVAAVIGAVAYPSPSMAGTQVFNCIVDNTGLFRQPWTVPSGVTEISASLQGAHGTTPGGGSPGGAGGVTQGVLPVTPGESLEVWVGCSGTDPVGFGFGGLKGVASGLGFDGGFGGGGTAITTTDGNPLLVAGGGGGGNGILKVNTGGSGGVGGIIPQAGQDGNGPSGGDGGCVSCESAGDTFGGNGGDAFAIDGAGGGGGGGWEGGGGGSGASSAGSGGGGGGGGGGLSYEEPSATDVDFGISQLPGDGVAVISWGVAGAAVPEPGTALLFMTALAALAALAAAPLARRYELSAL